MNANTIPELPNLRVFTTMPGIVMTAMQQEVFFPFAKDHADLTGMLALYLVQPRADFLKGSMVSVNWDVEELEASWNEIEGSRELTLALKGFMESTRKHKVCRSCCLKTSNFFGFYYAEQRWTPT